ncbi:hypothetical protein Misp01_53420 [Microtetraspora sp. NBRC 13810]|nr:hypothetical protein Misp01_53420 [Microtetraspora sp. NBRC 13810]
MEARAVSPRDRRSRQGSGKPRPISAEIACSGRIHSVKRAVRQTTRDLRRHGAGVDAGPAGTR